MADAETQPLLQNDTTTGYQGGQVDIVEGKLNALTISFVFLYISKCNKYVRSLLKVYASFF